MPFFVGSFQNLGDSWERNEHVGLISAQIQSLELNGNLLAQSYPDSNGQISIAGDKIPGET